MRSEIEYISRIAELTDGEFDLFKASLHMLLSRTFIIRGREQEEELYDFAIRNIPVYDAWFSCMDAGIVKDESLGVIAFRGGGSTRLRLGREETCALLVFRLLYEEKRTELSLTSFPSVTVLDFTQKYDAMTNGNLKKTRLEEILRRLQAHKLIEVLSSDPSDAEGLIILYPSLAVSVNKDSLDELLNSMGGRTGGDGADTPEGTDT
ncbi:MAG: DUF4194 domain-containing protein [Spirochaetaceae bacterium]|jgi:hypothetical protein|nr:DUF4194 domain-containing protein [Spirochaetaceae bacterium]